MEDSNNVNVANDIHIQNTNKKSTWHTGQDNCASLNMEDVKGVDKIDSFDDTTLESRVDITQVDDRQNISKHSVNNQNESENNSDLMNNDNTNHNEIFCCNICKSKFALNYQLKTHMENQHKKPTQENVKSIKCKFCGKKFKLHFSLNRHIEKSHSNLTECEICKCVVEKSVYNEHMQTHGNSSDKKIDMIPNLKLCKLNGVWKSKPNSIYKCNICLEKFDSQNNLTKHIEMHKDDDDDDDDCQILSDDDCQILSDNDCQILSDNDSQILSDDKLNLYKLQLGNESELKCQKCNRKFDHKQIFNLHTSHCTKSSQKIWRKFQNQVEDKKQTTYDCTNCKISFTSASMFKYHDVTKCCYVYNCCKNCGTNFTSEKSWYKHLDELNKHKKCIASTNTSQHQNLNTNNISHGENSEIIQCTNVAARNSSDQIDTGAANKIKLTVLNDSGVNVSYENSPCTNVASCSYSDQNNIRKVSNIASVVSQNSLVNNCIAKIKKEKDFIANTAVRSSLDQIYATNSNESIIQSLSPHSVIANNSGMNIKKEKISCTITSRINNLDQIHAANYNESIVPSTSHNLTMSNYGLNIKKEKISSLENFTYRNGLEFSSETDATNNVGSIVQATSSYNSLMNNCVLNIKKEKCLNKNVNENNSSNLLNASNRINEVNTHIVPQTNMINNIRVKREPEDNHNGMHTVNEPIKYFYISKLRSYKNVNSYYTMYTCIICKMASEDLHTFALHMSDHKECSMHECVVCDLKFSTVCFWTSHMNYHQREVDLNLSNSQINPTRVESNINNTTCLESMEPQAHSSNSFNRENKPKLKIDYQDSSSSNISVSNCVKNSRKLFSCNLCKNVFPTKFTLMSHQTLHVKSRQIKCKYCERIFSSRGPCTNHEKSHSSDGYKGVVEGVEHQYEIPNSVQVEGINVQPVLTIRKKKKKRILKSKYCYCNICRKKFSKRCYLTNHLKLLHHINPNLNNKIDNVNDKKSINKCKKMELSTELGAHSSVSMDKSLNNVDSEIIHQQSTLTSPLTTHSRLKFTCQYCGRQFNQRGCYSNHIKSHSNKKFKKVKKFNNKNLSIVKIERNEEHQQGEIYNSSELVNSSLIEPSTTNVTLIAAVTNHVTTDSGLTLHNCEFCGKQFTKKSSYSNHIKCHSNKRYKKNKYVNSTNLNNVKIEVNEDHQQEENDNMSEFVNSSFIEPSIINVTKKNRLWFPCDVCEKKFSTPFQLVVHRRTHCGIEPYLCKICNKSYSVRHRWNRHLKSHYWKNKLKNKSKSNKQINASKLDTGTCNIEPVQRQNEYKCGYCKKEYYLISQWKKHMTLSKECRRHCKNSLPEFMSNHARENFTKSKRFECHICNRSYSTLYNRKVHLINVHKVLDEIDLDTNASVNVIEQKNIVNTETIQRHSKLPKQKRSRLITTDNKNQCNLCGKCYSNRANLLRHQNISHTVDMKVIKCTICNKSFKHKYTFREHLRSTHNQLLSNNGKTSGNKSKSDFNYNCDIAQYSCKVCKMEFSNNALLESHIISHTLYKYECNDCGQKFETNVTLGEHILNCHNVSSTPNDNKRSEIQMSSSQPINDNLKCKICSKVVKAASYLPVHMRVHSGARPFKCDKCKASFRFESNLRIHRRKHDEANVST